MRLGEMLLSFLHLSLWPHNPKCAQSSNFMHLGITWNKINAHLLLLWLNCKRSSEPGHAGPWMPSKAFFSYRRSCYLVGWRLAQAHSKQQKVLGQPFLTGRGTEEGRMVQRQRSVIGVRANKNISWAFLSVSSPEPLICQFPSGRKSQGLSASCWASLGHQASLLLLQAATHPEGGKALSAICQSQQSYFFSTHYSSKKNGVKVRICSRTISHQRQICLLLSPHSHEFMSGWGRQGAQAPISNSQETGSSHWKLWLLVAWTMGEPNRVKQVLSASVPLPYMCLFSPNIQICLRREIFCEF